jgi:hypothetical protein
VDGVRVTGAQSTTATEWGDRLALELQDLFQRGVIDAEQPLLRIDNRFEAARAPFRLDPVHGKLHRTGCPAIPATSSAALYAVWDPGSEAVFLACRKCRPSAVETAKMKQDTSFDILYGLLSIVDQFGSVLTERGKEYRKSSRGRQLSKGLRKLMSELNGTESEAVRLAAASLDGLVRVVRQASAELERDGAPSGNRNGRPRQARARGNHKPGV